MTDAAASLTKALSAATDALPEARRRYTALLADIRAVKARSHSLKSAPLDRADTEAALASVLGDCQAAIATDPELREQLRYIQRTPSVLLNDEPRADLAPTPRRPESLGRLLFAVAASKTMLKVLSSAAEALDYTDSGPPVTERASELARLSDQLDDLEAERETLAAALVRAGEDLTRWDKPEMPSEGDTIEFTDVTGCRWRGTWRTLRHGHGAETSGYFWLRITDAHGHRRHQRVTAEPIE